jgi:hypothetical protein
MFFVSFFSVPFVTDIDTTPSHSGSTSLKRKRDSVDADGERIRKK